MHVWTGPDCQIENVEREKDIVVYESPRNPPNTDRKFKRGADLLIHKARWGDVFFYLYYWSMWMGESERYKVITKEEAKAFLLECFETPEHPDLTESEKKRIAVYFPELIRERNLTLFERLPRLFMGDTTSNYQIAVEKKKKEPFNQNYDKSYHLRSFSTNYPKEALEFFLNEIEKRHFYSIKYFATNITIYKDAAKWIYIKPKSDQIDLTLYGKFESAQIAELKKITGDVNAKEEYLDFIIVEKSQIVNLLKLNWVISEEDSRDIVSLDTTPSYPSASQPFSPSVIPEEKPSPINETTQQDIEKYLLQLRKSIPGQHENARLALARIGIPAIGPVITAIRDGCDSGKAGRVLALIGKPAVLPLIAALNDDNDHVRQAAAFSLGQIRDEQAVEALIVTLNDKNYKIQWSSALALGQIGDARAIEPLTQLLKDENPKIRRAGLQGLFLLDNPRIKDLLQSMTTDVDEGVRKDAAEKLKIYGSLKWRKYRSFSIVDEDRKKI